ncbi:hypothetical protein [Gracilimonas sp.]|uniref:hypothetical protein n=1 Tax=Gracilimonas sp. TaxID=1974203 RepID=UPI003BAB6DEA
MFNAVGSLAFFIPVILYVIVLGTILWLVMRLVRSNERIADNTDRIARGIKERNLIEKEKLN